MPAPSPDAVQATGLRTPASSASARASRSGCRRLRTGRSHASSERACATRARCSGASGSRAARTACAPPPCGRAPACATAWSYGMRSRSASGEAAAEQALRARRGPATQVVHARAAFCGGGRRDREQLGEARRGSSTAVLAAGATEASPAAPQLEVGVGGADEALGDREDGRALASRCAAVVASATAAGARDGRQRGRARRRACRRTGCGTRDRTGRRACASRVSKSRIAASRSPR